MKAAIYVRISKDHAGESLGVQRQEQDCRELADRLGWDVADVYVDNDLSATTGVVRPAYQRMLGDMRDHRLDGVIAWIPDRIYRQPVELEELITIADANNIQFATVKAGSIDLSTSSGRLVARILGAAAKHEVEIKSERQIAQKKQAAHAGVPNQGGVRPFGWKDDRLTVDVGEATVIVKAADMILSGQSLNGVVDWLHDEGVQTPRGKVRWYPIVVRRMLSNPRLAGLSTYKGEIVGTGNWETILDHEVWHRVNERLTRPTLNEMGTPRRAGGTSLLISSVLRCGTCGYGLLTNSSFSKKRPERIRVYSCREKYVAGRPGYRKSCGSLVINANYLEDDIAERLLSRILAPTNRAVIGSANQSDTSGERLIVRDIADLEERLRVNAEDWADRVITRAEFLATSARITERIAEKRRKLTVADSPRVPTGSVQELAEWWEAASLSQRRAVVDAQILSVVVNPQKSGRHAYDGSRVEVTWR